MKRIETQQAPAAIGPYSQGIVFNQMLYTSGQIALRPDGSFNDGDIEVQTRQVFANLLAIVQASGATLSQVVKSTVFLKNLDDFVKMNEIYAEVFNGHQPARSTVQVAKLPKDALVEIELIVALV